jgi:ribose transport system ATP-binding protein
VENICKSFPGTQALKGVSLEIKEGEIHSLVGENGAGKSTLVNIISGVLSADTGKVFLQGDEVHYHNPSDAQRAGVGFVHQELALCPHVTVADNVFFGRLPQKMGIVDRKALNEKARKVLEPFGANIRPEQKVADLSIAQQQIVEIARALSLDCKIVIFDEPTSSLNENEAESLFEIIKDIKKKGIGVIYISHKLSEIYAMCDRITVLRDGNKIATHNVADITAKKVISEMVGREIGNLYPPKSEELGKTLMEVKNLSKKEYFDNISFSVKEGEILGLGGLVGAGRTEVSRAICGIDPLDQGELYIHDEKIKINKYRDAIRNGLCYLSEDRKLDGLFLGMSITHNIIPLILKKVSKKMLMQRKMTYDTALKYKKILNIKFAAPNQKVSSLSGGNQQKVMIAKLLAVEPKIIIMDEPTRGIDVGAKSEIHNMLRELCDKGIGIIVISSEMPELIGLCDRIVIMNEGQKHGELKNSEITQKNIISMISESKAC